MSLDARLGRYLMEHRGERVQIRHLVKRFNTLPGAVIRFLEYYHWRPCGEGFFIEDTSGTSE